MENYQFTIDDSKRELLISIKAQKFDASRMNEFKEQLDQNWVDSIETVTLDFADVQFIDSSGIGALLGIQKRLKPDGDPLFIKNANQHVVEIIKLLRLQRVFSLV